MTGDDIAYLSYLGILLFFIGGGFLYSRRGKLGQTLQQAVIWMLIFAAVIIAYGFKDTLQSQLFPGQPVLAQDGNYVLQRNRDGHFYLTLDINGTPIEFVVDTGATKIVLTKMDARKIGLEPDDLFYLNRAHTANGVVKTASVVLERVELGKITDFRISAEVNNGEMDGSLLGMTYLSRFQEMRMRGNRLTLIR